MNLLQINKQEGNSFEKCCLFAIGSFQSRDLNVLRLFTMNCDTVLEAWMFVIGHRDWQLWNENALRWLIATLQQIQGYNLKPRMSIRDRATHTGRFLVSQQKTKPIVGHEVQQTKRPDYLLGYIFPHCSPDSG